MKITRCFTCFFLLAIYACITILHTAYAAEGVFSGIRIVPVAQSSDYLLSYSVLHDEKFVETLESALKGGTVLEIIHSVVISKPSLLKDSTYVKQKNYWFVSLDTLQGAYHYGPNTQDMQSTRSFNKLLLDILTVRNSIITPRKPFKTGGNYTIRANIRFEEYPRDNTWLDVITLSGLWQSNEITVKDNYRAR